MPKDDPMKPALLVIDMQSVYLPMMDADGKESALCTINQAIDLFRGKDLPIIRIYHTDAAHGPQPGTEPFAFPATVHVGPQDPMVVKTYSDGFNKTDLHALLTERGCDTVFLCGLSAVGCAFATYIGAENRDYRAFFVRDALLRHDAVLTRGMENTHGAVDLAAVEVMLEGTGGARPCESPGSR
jgi:nicotinamidase-related amidase